jgi:hypothetical protein
MSDIGKSDEVTSFFQTQFEELLEMSDEEILEGVSPEALKSESAVMIAAAKAEAGLRRMAAARAGIAVRKASAISTMPQVSIDKARAFLETAMNDVHYTLAARSLGEMSDDDILRLYNQLHQLKSANESPDNGKQ